MVLIHLTQIYDPFGIEVIVSDTVHRVVERTIPEATMAATVTNSRVDRDQMLRSFFRTERE